MNDKPASSRPADASIHALSGAYAVDAVDDLERLRFEAHLAGCADCRAEVQGLRAAAALLAETTPVAPPPALRDRVLADISRVRPLPPEAPEPAPAAGPVPGPSRADAGRRRWARLLAAAAAVLGVVGIGALATQPWEHGSQQAPISVADRVLHAPDAQRVAARFPGGARATLVRSVALGRAVLVTRDMPPAPGGKVYELWLQDRAGTMKPAGLMPPGSDETVVLDGNAASATAAGITVEPAGGSARPTTAPIALFDFSRAQA